MTDKCCNVDNVFINFNKMADGRAFTDYNAHHVTDIHLFKKVGAMCSKNNNNNNSKTNNSYDSRICVQRNTDKLIKDTRNFFESKYNIPRCNK